MRLPMETLRALLDYHYSRREQVYAFIATLTPEEFTRDMQAGWKNIRSTLMHCLEAEVFWMEHGLQKRDRPDWDFRLYPDIAAVRQKAAAVRAGTEALVQRLTEEDLVREASIRFSSGTEFSYSIGRCFLHVITHDTHHRGQVMLMARQMGHTPPEIDLM